MTNELGKTQASENVQGNPSDDNLDRKVRYRAYQIWNEEGQPQGRDREHWIRAKAEVLARQPNR